MKIGIILPIFSIDSLGYQYNAKLTIENLASFSDRLYIKSNGILTPELKKLNIFSNISIIANKETQSFDENGNITFDLKKNKEANFYVLNKMRKEGMDIAIMVHINQYIPNNSKKNIQNICAKLLKSNKKYAWLYKRYQIANKLTYPDTRLPWIINLHHQDLSIAPDSLSEKNKIIASIQSGYFKQFQNISIIDYQFELNIQDQKEKVNFTKNYSDVNAEKGIIVKPYFSEKEYLQFYQKKMDKKILTNDSLDQTGEKIYKNNQKDFLSNYLLSKYKPPTNFYKLLRILRFQYYKLLDFTNSV
jgi:hypothetical protein